jgi:hypothetical protein
MRPDISCTTGDLVSGDKGTPKGIPCRFYFYVDSGPPASRHKCTIFEVILENLKTAIPPKNLIETHQYTRSNLHIFFKYCWFLTPQASGTFHDEVVCIRCGECCRFWPKREFTTTTDPAKPPNWKGRGNPENPCTNLTGPDGEGKYSCSLWGLPEFPEACAEYPRGVELDMFDQFLEWTSAAVNITQSITTPNCAFRFERRSI